MDPADPHNLHDTADHPVLETIDIATEGNDCDECVRALREPLMRIDGVKDVKADPETERVYHLRRAQNPRACSARRDPAQWLQARPDGGLGQRRLLLSQAVKCAQAPD
jgi:copper chaperone CopZ